MLALAIVLVIAAVAVSPWLPKKSQPSIIKKENE